MSNGQPPTARHQRECELFHKYLSENKQDGSLISVSSLLSRAAAERRSAPALFIHDTVVTYEDWYAEVRVFAQKLRGHGVSKNDKIVLFIGNSVEFLIAYCAVWQCGATVVPLNIYFHEKELALILAEVAPKLVITHAPLIDKIVGVAGCPVMLAEDLRGNDEESGSNNWIASAKSARKDCDFQEQSDGEVRVEIAPDDIAVILYTSGTTGVPKGVMLSGKNVITNALQCKTRFVTTIDADQNERFFGILPFFHVFSQNTCIWLPLLLGAGIIVVPRIERREVTLGLRHKPTVFLGFPALFGLLLLMKNADLENVKVFISGADGLPDKIRTGFELLYGRKICSGYGLTEASPVVAVAITNKTLPSHYVGDVFPGIETRIIDEQGAEVTTPGTVGKLFIRGDNIMVGYYNAPDATKAVLSADGWLATGDLACFDADQHLAICGRSKEIIISKGFNIYPQEVENILLKHPLVFKAAVIGISDEAHGQAVIAFVASRAPDRLSHSDLKMFCSEHLASYKVPRVCIIRDDLPLSPTGKIDKKKLKEEYHS